MSIDETTEHVSRRLQRTRNDDAPNTPPGTVAPTPSVLTMDDVTTLQQVDVARGGTRGYDVIVVTRSVHPQLARRLLSLKGWRVLAVSDKGVAIVRLAK